MEFLKLTFLIFVITFIGWNILYLISGGSRRSYLLESLAISYGLGVGFISLWMLLFYFLHVEYNTPKIILPWIALPLINLIIYFKKRKFALAKKQGKTNNENGGTILKVFLICGIIFEILYAIFRALIKPIEAYDAIAIYAIKAKIFYVARSIPRGFFQNLALHFPHPDYPLNIPLTETLGYMFLGNPNDQLVKLIFPLYFIAILTVIYFGITRFASKTYALIFTFLLASIPQFNAYAANAYLDLPMAYYCFISSLFLFRWFENRNEIRFLAISAITAALAGWTKNEGLMYCSINTFLLVIFFILEDKRIEKKSILSALGYVSLIFIISLPWLWIKKSAHLVNEDVGPISLNPYNMFKQFYKIFPIIYEFQKQFLGPKKWNIVWPMVFIPVIFNHRKAFCGVKKYITLSLLLILSGYIFFYMTSKVEITYFLSKTWSRFLIHFLPIVVYWLAHMLKEDIKV